MIAARGSREKETYFFLKQRVVCAGNFYSRLSSFSQNADLLFCWFLFSLVTSSFFHTLQFVLNVRYF